MSKQYPRRGEQKGRRGFWCVTAALAIASGAVAGLAVISGGGEARAQQENLTVDGVLDRVEGARGALGALSYRLVMSRQYHNMPDGGRWADHSHLTVDVLEEGDLRRSRMEGRQLSLDTDTDREYHFSAVRNDHAIGIRGKGATTDVWDLEVVGTDSPGWQRFKGFAHDYLQHGFGTGANDLSESRARTDPDSYRLRVVERDGRTQIELRPRAWETGDRPRGGLSLVVEPERGYLITRAREYARGELIAERTVEPVLIEDQAGESRWFPGSAEETTWVVDEDGRELRWHSVLRFEDVRLNRPVDDEAFALATALEWEDGHMVRIWDAERPRERAQYWEGELIDVEPIALRGE